MKTFLLAVTALLAVGFVSSQSEPWCRCAMFVSSSNAEIMVYELPQVNITDCNSHNQCKNRCTNEFNEMTNNMDLWSTVDGDTVGHYICQNLYSNFIFFIHNSYVHAYYEMCGGPWEYTGLDSQQMLCCNVGQHEHCISR
ncbi:uncharacterized protein [Penaeus vannamei]|uniref:uncharacterized protein n=1 Tax=Penaeus vannamei TaxID=6689 RepID=UPI000F689F60|nr:uncharacterized protein LOC113819426 [Penaeus vannamei]